MKLLIVTQKVNKRDPILGFFHEWIRKFSEHCESVTVICLEMGEYDLPKNVRVFSLGKEINRGLKSVSKSKLRFSYLYKFQSYIWNERKNYDAVFVHMNPVYVVFGGLFWALLGKKIFLWYTHKNVDLKLRVAAFFAHDIFTASKESFRLMSRKLHVVGHGIDTQIFSPSKNKISQSIVLSVSRISKTKNQLLMVQAIRILREKNPLVRLVLVGSAITSQDIAYEKELKAYIHDQGLIDAVEFVGDVAPSDIPAWYNKADILLNLSDTGSLDKAVLEAMASGMQVLTANEAFAHIVPETNFTKMNVEEIATKISDLLRIPADSVLREYVVKNHNISNLIPELVRIMSKNS